MILAAAVNNTNKHSFIKITRRCGLLSETRKFKVKKVPKKIDKINKKNL